MQLHLHNQTGLENRFRKYREEDEQMRIARRKSLEHLANVPCEVELTPLRRLKIFLKKLTF